MLVGRKSLSLIIRACDIIYNNVQVISTTTTILLLPQLQQLGVLLLLIIEVNIVYYPHTRPRTYLTLGVMLEPNALDVVYVSGHWRRDWQTTFTGDILFL